MGQFSITHLLLLAVLALLFFGPNRLPQLGQSLGRALRGFKEGLNEIETEAKEITSEVNTAHTEKHRESEPTHKS